MTSAHYIHIKTPPHTPQHMYICRHEGEYELLQVYVAKTTLPKPSSHLTRVSQCARFSPLKPVVILIWLTMVLPLFALKSVSIR